MVGQRVSRLRAVALTGALAPGLILGAFGAVGFSGLPGGILPAGVVAQSLTEGTTCTAFGDTTASAAADLSVAEVAESVSPAVVTIVNLQPIGEAEIGGFPGIEGLPGLPDIPGIDDVPDIEDVEGGDELPGIDDAPEGDDAQPSDDAEDDDEQTTRSAAHDGLVPAGTGSGFIVDELGHVVTNAHVVAGAEELTVALSDGTEVPAEVVGSDALLDVAMLALNLEVGETVPKVATFGDSSTLRAGERVVAINNAFGSFPNAVSEGIVNATNRSFPSEGGLTTWIQHDAGIRHGNSGGPLLNLRGEVVGINTAGISSGMTGRDIGSADMAFAVEGNTVCSAAADLLANGEIVWPYLGIQGEATAAGQTVVEVVDDGPSDVAGLEVGDVIIALEEQEINRQNSLPDLLFGHNPGNVVTVTVDRDGETVSFQVTLGERPDST